ncbi:uncharacterized protein LOC116270837 [Papio anubis]|uniref:uncharacterized protein LOC101020601 n=1 Tax=Papio anubis TaxID=9555 RepID=UPI0012ADEC01|nr:uncharacterized protein LOC101020601 [Papio anubis]XP_031512765.1 uncharacterized protein LOC116270837 [Papio anubis]
MRWAALVWAGVDPGCAFVDISFSRVWDGGWFISNPQRLTGTSGKAEARVSFPLLPRAGCGHSRRCSVFPPSSPHHGDRGLRLSLFSLLLFLLWELLQTRPQPPGPCQQQMLSGRARWPFAPQSLVLGQAREGKDEAATAVPRAAVPGQPPDRACLSPQTSRGKITAVSAGFTWQCPRGPSQAPPWPLQGSCGDPQAIRHSEGLER